MKVQSNPSTSVCPVTRASIRAEARAAFDEAVRVCDSSDATFALFETQLFVLMATLGRCLIRLFLTARHERLEFKPFLQDGTYRCGDGYAERTLKTFYGDVLYGRQYLMPQEGGSGIFPLDGAGTTNAFTATPLGTADFYVTTPAHLTTFDRVLLIYNSDGLDHPMQPGTFGVDSHVELVLRVKLV